MTERYSVQVLRECIELQNKKGQDYQNAVSTVQQADYYRLGLNTIYDIMHAKMLRIRSLLETAEANPTNEVKFESISDSAKDLINYASFFASYAEGKMEGQNPDHDIFNKPINITNLYSTDKKYTNLTIEGDLNVNGNISARNITSTGRIVAGDKINAKNDITAGKNVTSFDGNITAGIAPDEIYPADGWSK